MDYEKIFESINRAVESRPLDHGAYADLFSLCRTWENDDFARAHEVNKQLRGKVASKLREVSSKEAAFFYDQWRKCLLFDAPHDFDSFMLYIELDRKPDKRFYAPRRHYLRPMVQGFQDILDGKLRLLTISMPKRAGKSQTGINFVNMLSGKYPDRSTLMEGTGDDLVKSFYSGCLEYLQTPNEYLFYDVFPEAKLVQTNADTKTINLRAKARFPTVMCRSIDARQVGLSEATNVLYPDDHPEAAEHGMTRGSYGKGRGKQKAWGYYGDPGTNGEVKINKKGREVVITHGNPANMPMYETVKELEEKLGELAKEVFS